MKRHLHVVKAVKGRFNGRSFDNKGDIYLYSNDKNLINICT